MRSTVGASAGRSQSIGGHPLEGWIQSVDGLDLTYGLYFAHPWWYHCNEGARSFASTNQCSSIEISVSEDLTHNILISTTLFSKAFLFLFVLCQSHGFILFFQWVWMLNYNWRIEGLKHIYRWVSIDFILLIFCCRSCLLLKVLIKFNNKKIRQRSIELLEQLLRARQIIIVSCILKQDAMPERVNQRHQTEYF